MGLRHSAILQPLARVRLHADHIDHIPVRTDVNNGKIHLFRINYTSLQASVANLSYL